ncbi:wax ester/triacylglycerol synthase family O-acyltransferase [Nocardioides salsibiostraticola]
MERMDGADAGFLYMETPTMHQHTLKISILEPQPGVTFDRFRRTMMSRIEDLPPLRRRVLPVPFGLNHPVWIADRPLNPDRHLFHHHVAAPGGMRELETLIGEIASTGLDRRHPLWEMHLCEGLADGRVAVVGKMHHALADGAAANALLANVADTQGVPLPPLPESEDLPGTLEPTPTRRTLVTSALLDAIRQLGDVPALVWRTIRGLFALGRHRRGATTSTPRPVLDAPRVSFNGPLSTRRVFATCSVPLEQVKEVRRTHGVTVNDVVLAMVAGALRNWMDDRGERPSGPLVAGVPVGTDAKDAAPRLAGNRVSNLFTTLATDVDDPAERLQTISRVTAEAKKMQQALGANMLTDWVQFTPPAPFAAAVRLYSRKRTAARHAAPFNVIVSNVAGPREYATISGAGLSDLFSVGPVLEGIGLNMTAWSYVDRLNFSVLSCPELVPDLPALVAYLRPALDELSALDAPDHTSEK